MNGIYLLITALILRTLTDLSFKASVHNLYFGKASDLFKNALIVAQKPIMWMAIFFAIVNLRLWIEVLSIYDLSFAYPLFSFAYVLMMISGKIFFKESLDIYKYTGMGLIVIGSLILLRFA